MHDRAVYQAWKCNARESQAESRTSRICGWGKGDKSVIKKTDLEADNGRERTHSDATRDVLDRSKGG